MTTRSCDACLETDKKIQKSIEGDYLCEECYLKPEFKMICKTTAISKYKVNAEELSHLESYEKKNPHYRRAAPMILYKESIVRMLACDKHRCSMDELDKVLENFQNMKEMKKQEREEKKLEASKKRSNSLDELLKNHGLNVEKNNIYYTSYIDGTIDCTLTEIFQHIIEQKAEIEQSKLRHKELEEALKNVGLTIRRDSKLCAGYINGSINFSIKQVVQRVCEVHFLYNYMNLKSYLNQIYESNRELRYICGDDFGSYNTFDEAEETCMRGRTFPKIWPWLSQEAEIAWKKQKENEDELQKIAKAQYEQVRKEKNKRKQQNKRNILLQKNQNKQNQDKQNQELLMQKNRELVMQYNQELLMQKNQELLMQQNQTKEFNDFDLNNEVNNEIISHEREKQIIETKEKEETKNLETHLEDLSKIKLTLIRKKIIEKL